MTILLLGKNGQVGWELQRSLAPLGKVIALNFDSFDYCGVLSDGQGLATTICTPTPDVIINTATYTAVDKAESEPALARQRNAEGSALIAHEAKWLGSSQVHYSMDDVFDGQGCIPWQESDTVAPLNDDGITKLEGDQAMQPSGCQHLIFRTSWVCAARSNNFARAMLRLAQERESLNVVDDQYGAPTGTELLADVTALALRMARNESGHVGLYHLVVAGETTRCQYARFVLAQAQLNRATLKVAPAKIGAITSDRHPTAARRPQNSRLNTQKLRADFALTFPDWQSGVKRMLSEILEDRS